MIKQKDALVKWAILDDEQEWQESLSTFNQCAEVAVAQASKPPTDMYLSILALLLLLVVLGGWLWTRQNRAATPQKGSLATVEARPQHIAMPRYSITFDEDLQQRIDTPHFSFTFYAVHAEVVQEVAPKLEALYVKLCDDFGEAEGDCFFYYKIDVLPNKILPDDRPARSHFNSAQDSITILASNPLFAPEDGNAAYHLYTALIYPVVSMHLLNIVESKQTPLSREVVDIEETQLMLSEQSDDNVNWLNVMLALRLWIFYEESGRTGSAYVHLARWSSESWETPPAPVMDGTLASAFDSVTGLAAVLGYGFATYGREGLAALLARYGQPTGREEMIQLLFDLSYADFEAGWQARMSLN